MNLFEIICGGLLLFFLATAVIASGLISLWFVIKHDDGNMGEAL
jgi:hypothetical protein